MIEFVENQLRCIIDAFTFFMLEGAPCGDNNGIRGSSQTTLESNVLRSATGSGYEPICR